MESLKYGKNPSGTIFRKGSMMDSLRVLALAFTRLGEILHEQFQLISNTKKTLSILLYSLWKQTEIKKMTKNSGEGLLPHFN